MATTLASPFRLRNAAARVRERRLREAAGLLLNYAGIQVVLGVAWDSTWHYSVGRDTFLYVPSHMLLYTATALAGLVCLTLLLAETLRYRGGGEVHEGNSMAILGLVRAPIGIALSSFGVFTIFIAAPLDNYWHTLYGAFLHVSSPFHMMDVIGGAIFFLGSLYLWGALAVDASQRGDPLAARRAQWGEMIAAALVLRLMMALSNPGLSVFQTLSVGGLRFMAYPVLLAMLNTWMLVAVAEGVRRPYAATIVAMMLLLFEFVIQVFVPGAVRVQAAFEGREFLSPMLIPHFSLQRLAPQALVLIAAVFVDMLHRRRCAETRSPVLTGVGPALVLWAGGSVCPLSGHVRSLLPYLPAGIGMAPLADASHAILALLPALGAGAASGLLGYGLGQVLRLNPR